MLLRIHTDSITLTDFAIWYILHQVSLPVVPLAGFTLTIQTVARALCV
jgi:hypothetical protein